MTLNPEETAQGPSVIEYVDQGQAIDFDAVIEALRLLGPNTHFTITQLCELVFKTEEAFLEIEDPELNWRNAFKDQLLERGIIARSAGLPGVQYHATSASN